jgi:hypothetical protein
MAILGRWWIGPKTLVQDLLITSFKRLTLEARRLHHLLLSYLHNWKIWIVGLVADRLETEAAIRSAIAELIALGYVRTEIYHLSPVRNPSFMQQIF